MKLNLKIDEIKSLILQLANKHEHIADYAMKTLLAVPRNKKVPLLIEALAKSDDYTKQKICFILGGTDDERCIEPLLALLAEPNPAVKLAAMDALQFFAVPTIVPHLSKQLYSKKPEIRWQAVMTLASLLKLGVKEAGHVLAEKVKDETEDEKIRRMALKELRYFPAAELKPILKQFSGISSASIYAEILFMEEALAYQESPEYKDRIKKLVDKFIQIDNILDKIKFEEKLLEHGSLVISLMLEQLFENPDDVKLSADITRLLDRMGARAIPALKKAFDSYNDFENYRLAVAITILFFPLENERFKPVMDSVVSLLNRLNTYIDEKRSEQITTEFDYIKSEIHLLIAKHGCKDAIADLKELIGDGTNRCYVQIIEAAGRVGGKEFIIPLLNLYKIKASDFEGKAIKKAFKAIVKREKVKRADEIFLSLDADQQQVLEQLLPRRRHSKKHK